MPFARALIALVVAAGLHAPRAQAQADALNDADLRGASVVVVGPQINTDQPFVVLSTGGLFLLRGQRVVVTQEPAPAAVVTEAPPAAPVDALTAPVELAPKTLWVPGHWAHGSDGFVWRSGRTIAAKPGHVFVPPRWVVVNGRHLFFDGFFVPHRVWVRSFFNTFHFSGDPTKQATANTRDRGPYWPIGVSGRPVGVSTTRGRGPYWPLGLGPPTVVNQRGGTVVGLPSNSSRR